MSTNNKMELHLKPKLKLTPETMKQLGSTEKRIIKDKNG